MKTLNADISDLDRIRATQNRTSSRFNEEHTNRSGTFAQIDEIMESTKMQDRTPPVQHSALPSTSQKKKRRIHQESYIMGPTINHNLNSDSVPTLKLERSQVGSQVLQIVDKPSLHDSEERSSHLLCDPKAHFQIGAYFQNDSEAHIMKEKKEKTRRRIFTKEGLLIPRNFDVIPHEKKKPPVPPLEMRFGSGDSLGGVPAPTEKQESKQTGFPSELLSTNQIPGTASAWQKQFDIINNPYDDVQSSMGGGTPQIHAKIGRLSTKLQKEMESRVLADEVLLKGPIFGGRLEEKRQMARQYKEQLERMRFGDASDIQTNQWTPDGQAQQSFVLGDQQAIPQVSVAKPSYRFVRMYNSEGQPNFLSSYISTQPHDQKAGGVYTVSRLPKGSQDKTKISKATGSSPPTSPSKFSKSVPASSRRQKEEKSKQSPNPYKPMADKIPNSMAKKKRRVVQTTKNSPKICRLADRASSQSMLERSLKSSARPSISNNKKKSYRISVHEASSPLKTTAKPAFDKFGIQSRGATLKGSLNQSNSSHGGTGRLNPIGISENAPVEEHGRMSSKSGDISNLSYTNSRFEGHHIENEMQRYVTNDIFGSTQLMTLPDKEEDDGYINRLTTDNRMLKQSPQKKQQQATKPKPSFLGLEKDTSEIKEVRASVMEDSFIQQQLLMETSINLLSARSTVGLRPSFGSSIRRSSISNQGVPSQSKFQVQSSVYFPISDADEKSSSSGESKQQMREELEAIQTAKSDMKQFGEYYYIPIKEHKLEVKEKKKRGPPKLHKGSPFEKNSTSSKIGGAALSVSSVVKKSEPGSDTTGPIFSISISQSQFSRQNDLASSPEKSLYSSLSNLQPKISPKGSKRGIKVVSSNKSLFSQKHKNEKTPKFNSTMNTRSGFRNPTPIEDSSSTSKQGTSKSKRRGSNRSMSFPKNKLKLNDATQSQKNLRNNPTSSESLRAFDSNNNYSRGDDTTPMFSPIMARFDHMPSKQDPRSRSNVSLGLHQRHKNLGSTSGGRTSEVQVEKNVEALERTLEQEQRKIEQVHREMTIREINRSNEEVKMETAKTAEDQPSSDREVMIIDETSPDVTSPDKKERSSSTDNIDTKKESRTSLRDQSKAKQAMAQTSKSQGATGKVNLMNQTTLVDHQESQADQKESGKGSKDSEGLILMAVQQSIYKMLKKMRLKSSSSASIPMETPMKSPGGMVNLVDETPKFALQQKDSNRESSKTKPVTAKTFKPIDTMVMEATNEASSRLQGPTELTVAMADLSSDPSKPKKESSFVVTQPPMRSTSNDEIELEFGREISDIQATQDEIHAHQTVPSMDVTKQPSQPTEPEEGNQTPVDERIMNSNSENIIISSIYEHRGPSVESATRQNRISGGGTETGKKKSHPESRAEKSQAKKTLNFSSMEKADPSSIPKFTKVVVNRKSGKPKRNYPDGIDTLVGPISFKGPSSHKNSSQKQSFEAGPATYAGNSSKSSEGRFMMFNFMKMHQAKQSEGSPDINQIQDQQFDNPFYNTYLQGQQQKAPPLAQHAASSSKVLTQSGFNSKLKVFQIDETSKTREEGDQSSMRNTAKSFRGLILPEISYANPNKMASGLKEQGLRSQRHLLNIDIQSQYSGRAASVRTRKARSHIRKRKTPLKKHPLEVKSINLDADLVDRQKILHRSKKSTLVTVPQRVQIIQSRAIKNNSGMTSSSRQNEMKKAGKTRIRLSLDTLKGKPPEEEVFLLNKTKMINSHSSKNHFASGEDLRNVIEDKSFQVNESILEHLQIGSQSPRPEEDQANEAQLEQLRPEVRQLVSNIKMSSPKLPRHLREQKRIQNQIERALDEQELQEANQYLEQQLGVLEYQLDGSRMQDLEPAPLFTLNHSHDRLHLYTVQHKTFERQTPGHASHPSLSTAADHNLNLSSSRTHQNHQLLIPPTYRNQFRSRRSSASQQQVIKRQKQEAMKQLQIIQEGPGLDISKISPSTRPNPKSKDSQAGETEKKPLHQSIYIRGFKKLKQKQSQETQ